MKLDKKIVVEKTAIKKNSVHEEDRHNQWDEKSDPSKIVDNNGQRDQKRNNLYNKIVENTTQNKGKEESGMDEKQGDDDTKSDIGPSNDHSSLESEIVTKTLKKGVVYIVRVPPFMTVSKIRDYMSQFGSVGRIYLTPEDPIHRKNRIMVGGSTKEMFKDGWVEFERKSVAKSVGQHLNNQPVGGKKRHNFWRDDIWNLRYLPRFKWHHLIDWRNEKKRSRQERKTAELLQMKRENAYYLDQVDKKCKMDHIEERRKKKQKLLDVEHLKSES